MSKDTKLSIIIVSVLFVATFAIFYMFRPAETSPVYYFNFAMTLFLEVLFGGLFPIAKGKNLSTPFWIVSWVSVGLYIMLSVGTMLVYFALVEPGLIKIVADVTIPHSYMDWVGDNLLEKIAEIFQENEALGRIIYFSCFIVLTAVSVITLAILWRIDSDYTADIQQLKEEQSSIIDIATEMEVLRKKYVRICAEKGIVYKTESNNTSAMDVLCQKLQFLTPNVVRHPRAQQKFGTILDEARQLISQLQNSSPEALEMANKAILNFVQDSVEEIDMLKTTCRS